MVRDAPEAKPVRYPINLTINEIIKRAERRRLAET
jgi:hypothetical protein